MAQDVNVWLPSVHDATQVAHQPLSASYKRPGVAKPSHRDADADSYARNEDPPRYIYISDTLLLPGSGVLLLEGLSSRLHPVRLPLVQ